MKDYQSLCHSTYCKYHVVFIPKYRCKILYGKLKHHLGEIFHELAKQKEGKIHEGCVHADHVHISIPPKCSVSNVVGFAKEKSAITIAWKFRGETKNLLVKNSGPEGILSAQ